MFTFDVHGWSRELNAVSKYPEELTRMKSTTVHIEDDPIIVLRSFVPDEEALNYVASLTNCDPEVVLTYATVVITKEGHVRVASPDPHDTCVESILVDGVQVVLACQQRTT